MSKRNAYLIAAGVVLLVVVLLLPSFAARAAVASLLLVIGLLFVIKSLLTQTSSEKFQTRPVGADQADDESPSGIFALGKLFEATMSGMREGLLVVDKDMRVVASNAAAHSLFNLSRGKLESQRLTELTRNPAIYGAFLDALKGTERSGVKVETHGPERLVFDLRVVPLAASNGKVAESAGAQGALGVFIDITRIERLEHVRQEFLSNVSHELRTPLTAILAFVETLETGAVDDKESSQRFLSIIRKNAFRMHDLIDDILELSAIEAGNVQVKAEQVELHPIVNDVISSLTSRSSAEGISVSNAVDREAMVYADARRLEQMLTNLVDNAIKFNRENGQVTIKFESGARVGEQRRRVQETPANWGTSPRISTGVVTQALQSETPRRDKIIVEDTGEGIPAQHLERLFERFYRVDRARSRDMGGTGLGLAIVKHLARAHGGEVTVTSELGKGSIFTIELPPNREQS
jgi:two-component system, OmpR family, phosphate regulon sensor histidine kinase PhoR